MHIEHIEEIIILPVHCTYGTIHGILTHLKEVTVETLEFYRKINIGNIHVKRIVPASA